MTWIGKSSQLDDETFHKFVIRYEPSRFILEQVSLINGKNRRRWWDPHAVFVHLAIVAEVSESTATCRSSSFWCPIVIIWVLGWIVFLSSQTINLVTKLTTFHMLQLFERFPARVGYDVLGHRLLTTLFTCIVLFDVSSILLVLLLLLLELLLQLFLFIILTQHLEG